MAILTFIGPVSIAAVIYMATFEPFNNTNILAQNILDRQKTFVLKGGHKSSVKYILVKRPVI